MYVGVPGYNLKKLYYQILHTTSVDRYLARDTGDLASTAGAPSYQFDTLLPETTDHLQQEITDKLAHSIGESAPEGLC